MCDLLGGISVEPAGYRYLISANLATACNLEPPTGRRPLNKKLEAEHWFCVRRLLDQTEYGMSFICEYNHGFVVMLLQYMLAQGGYWDLAPFSGSNPSMATMDLQQRMNL